MDMDRTEVNYGPSCHGGGATQNIKEHINNITIVINIGDETAVTYNRVRGILASALRALKIPVNGDNEIEFKMVEKGKDND